MKKTVRIVCFFLTICLILSGCSQGKNSHNGVIVTTSLAGKPVLVGDIAIEFPLVKKSTTLNILATGYENNDFENVYVWQQYEKMTNVNINWLTVSKSSRAEAVHTALTNRQNVDLITRCKLSAAKLVQYGKSGLILDLAKDDLLKTYAPNCWAYLQAHPDTLASVMNPDGTIYALPQVNSGAELSVSRKIFLNKNWLENVNMAVPTTTDELYEVLKAFKEQDANLNGDPNDEIPFCSIDWQSLEDVLFGAFGLGNREVHNHTVDCDPQTGEVRIIASSDSYRDFLQYLNTLYSEGLLDKYLFTITDEQWQSNAENDLIGAFASTNLAAIPADKTDNWVAIDEALEGPNGDKLWSAIRANFHSTGAAVIPANCSDPALVLKWLDYFWTDEGTLFYHMGVEGETFVANSDGSYDYTPNIYEEMKNENKSFDDVVAMYSPYPGGSNPTVEIAPYFMGGEMAEVPAQATRSLFEYGPSEYWPSFTFTEEESDSLNIIKADINKYITLMQVEFITGKTPFSAWDDYLDRLDKLKASEMLSIYQAALARYRTLEVVPD